MNSIRSIGGSCVFGYEESEPRCSYEVGCNYTATPPPSETVGRSWHRSALAVLCLTNFQMLKSILPCFLRRPHRSDHRSIDQKAGGRMPIRTTQNICDLSATIPERPARTRRADSGHSLIGSQHGESVEGTITIVSAYAITNSRESRIAVVRISVCIHYRIER